MSMNIFAPSSVVRVGDTITLPFMCSEPGTVAFTSDDESVATVEASKVVAGTREYSNELKHGQYLAREGASTAQRNPMTILFAVNPNTFRRSLSTYTYSFPIGCLFENGTDRGLINYSTATYRLANAGGLTDTFFCGLVVTNEPPVLSANLYGFTNLTLDGTDDIIRYAVTYDGTTIRRYTNSRALVASSVATILGTTGSEYFRIQHTLEAFAKYDRVVSNDELDAWFSDGTVSTTDLIAAYQGGHEIVESAPVFWDASANGRDLAAIITPPGCYPPSASGGYTDDPLNPVVPYSTVTVVAQSAGTCTISARRRRNGIPYRTPPLTDAEVYEDATYVLTVEEALASERSTVQLMIYADRDGTASITMDNPIIDFPASVPVVEGKNQVSGLVTGSGTCNVTVTLDGESDATQFIVNTIPVNLSIGPETTLDYEGLPITFNLVVSCDRPETTVNLSSTGVGITIPPTVVVTDVPVEIPVTINGFGEYSVTAESGSYSSTALIHSIEDTIELYLEADKDIHTKDLPVTFNMRVFCSRDGEVTLHATGTGVVIPDHADVVSGVAEFEVTISEGGEKIISAVFDTAYAECVLNISEEAFLISLGEDRHAFYQGNDVVITKTVYCNKEGLVNLTQVGTSVDMPSSVMIVDGIASFDITCSEGGSTLIGAESTLEPGVQTFCEIIITEIPIVLSLGADRVFDNHFDPITFTMDIFCNRDGVVALSSDNATVPASVVVFDGLGQFEVTCDETAVITASFGGTEDECTITLNDPPLRILYIGPDQTIVWESSEDEPVKYIIAMLVSDLPGTISLSSSDENLVVPASVVSDGKIYVTFETEGSCDAVVTATMGALTSSCRIIVQDEGTGCADETCQSGEDNVWALPDDRMVDPTMFVGDAEKDFSKQIAEELMEKVVNQLVFYYPIDVQATNYHPMYGESITKKFHPPVKVFALVEWKGYDTKNAAYSLDKVPVIEVHFSKRRLEEDQGLVVKEGDFIKYGRDFYEITALNENAELFGAFNKKVDVSATCVKARKGTFYIEDKAFAKDTDFSWE